MANIFEQFTNCLKDKDYNESLGFNSFMFCRFLGSSPSTLQLANVINILYKSLPDEAQYNLVRYTKNKPKFIRFAKALTESESIKEIQLKYKVNKEVAKLYASILDSIHTQKP
ncbi:DNA polymerase clamp loader subunit A [Campylobacter phage vB_CjeM_WX1]|nr:DNA polymerase clamp loader subunit A [Campylobacter phage vB_CjeM_WX1]